MRRFAWYDSQWLDDYAWACDTLRDRRPPLLSQFVESLSPCRTDPAFVAKTLDVGFTHELLPKLEATVRALRAADFEMHEIGTFGRLVIHDHPVMTEVQHTLIDLVSEAAEEPVEMSYNFLSLYTGAGVCPVHMDAPRAKWTLDVCIRQSAPWPIYLSQIVPWPEDLVSTGPNWESTIKSDPSIRFTPYIMEPGEALLFSGSSQWHYRDPHPGDGIDQFCDLAFFHFCPKGMKELIEPSNWPRIFDAPELGSLQNPVNS